MKLYDPTNSTWRKRRPLARGCLDYFPDALLEVAFLSWVGNQKHNPGQELHWSRGKSNDQADTIVRHLCQRGGFDEYEIANEDGEKEIVRVRHSVAAAWRALANAQEELEREEGRPLSPGSLVSEEFKAARDAMLRNGRPTLPALCAGGKTALGAVIPTNDPTDLPMVVQASPGTRFATP